MTERIGREGLLERLLAGTPDRTLDAVATVVPDDAADLGDLRRELADFASSVPLARPPARLRERLLAAHPRPRRPGRPVLLVLDMINDYLTPGLPLHVPRAIDIVPALQRRLAEARSVGLPVVYACDSHLAGDPDYDVWPLHALEGTDGGQVWPELAPLPGEQVVKKPTYSAFTRSDLGAVLDALGADQIILTGCATELGMKATALDALQRGYVVTIPPDSQAGVSALAENLTMLTLSAMPPYDPIYQRKERGHRAGPRGDGV